jgi:heme-degrading monooxygenase HmoA
VLDDFMAQVERVDRQVSALPGCRQHLVLMQLDPTLSARDCIQVMTIVEWADAQALQAAKAHLQRHYAREGFNPQAFMQALGVRAVMGH